MNRKHFQGCRLLVAVAITGALAVRLQAGVVMQAVPDYNPSSPFEIRDASGQTFRSLHKVSAMQGAIMRFDIMDGSVRSFLGAESHSWSWPQETTSAGFYEVSDRPRLDQVLRFVGMTGFFLGALAGGFDGGDSFIGELNGPGHSKESGTTASSHGRRTSEAVRKLNAIAQTALERLQGRGQGRRANVGRFPNRLLNRARGGGGGGRSGGGGGSGGSIPPIVGAGGDGTIGAGAPGTSGELPLPPSEGTVAGTVDGRTDNTVQDTVEDTVQEAVEDTAQDTIADEPPVVAAPIEIDDIFGVGSETPVDPLPLPILDDISTDGPAGVETAAIVTIDQAAHVVPEASSLIVWLLGLVTYGCLIVCRRSRFGAAHRV